MASGTACSASQARFFCNLKLLIVNEQAYPLFQRSPPLGHVRKAPPRIPAELGNEAPLVWRGLTQQLAVAQRDRTFQERQIAGDGLIEMDASPNAVAALKRVQSPQRAKIGEPHGGGVITV